MKHGWIEKLVAASVLCITLAPPCAADPTSLSALATDTERYFTAPLRWDQADWMRFAGTLGAIGVAHEYDAQVHSHFTSNANAASDTHGLRDAMPMVAMIAGTWAAAGVMDDRAGYKEGRIMLEAGALSALSTTMIKFATGRARPYEATGVDDWRSGGDSFPSMHVSTAFAVGTVLAESGSNDYRWLRRFIGYGLATATAYARVHDNAHWLSDTVAGASLGIATAAFSMNRGRTGDEHSVFSVMPGLDGGVMLTYSMTLR
jgi:hypothetical protein